LIRFIGIDTIDNCIGLLLWRHISRTKTMHFCHMLLLDILYSML